MAKNTKYTANFRFIRPARQTPERSIEICRPFEFELPTGLEARLTKDQLYKFAAGKCPWKQGWITDIQAA